ncbi:hypothetical protein NEUTE1DRAFT_143522 [Neurospora tetrasperma FGSC 2508]|uniref:Uncharacterized protein n=1 Tax=Neurospora tetrasperma (strain FGSC 2508 / ATCC MYA-4615 / P0657) TaxID=510951 RepID=F8N040_NEUT8|nr:uncharacterized protein NEUTE1DRAFT_143522 [Neurospora tetrasperma FGSC 2508]EGO53775.1 hypothetical protein NEUTE1DRAFT_143522 [Neurospora tetrasperma FGSC 2508]EGZ76143.1 hypothetical protein NEUTE2DRAFT_122798 [Neurospora tetrasperma FGSC 2509]
MDEAVNSNDDSDQSVVVIAQQDWVIISTTDTIDDQQQPHSTAFPSGHNKMGVRGLGEARISTLS